MYLMVFVTRVTELGRLFFKFVFRGHMKKWLLSGLFALACGASAAPATLVADEMGYDGYNGNDCCCPCEHFDGFYVGLDVGVISHQARRNDLDGFFTDNSGWTSLGTSGAVGAQIGYDWQCGCRVLGLVADWNYTRVSTTVLDNPGNTIGSHTKNKLDWYSTLRARAGVTVCCDTLVYLTAGVAWARFDTTFAGPTGQDRGNFHDKKARFGWAGGVGIEWALWCNWSLGAEFLALQFADKSRTFTGNDDGVTTFKFTNNDSIYTAKLSLNYRF